MSVMTSFKRKRIEKWCEEVDQHLNNGTICKQVIGNIAEDVICGAAMVPRETIDDNMTSNNANNNNTNVSNDGNNLNTKVDLALKKATQTLSSNEIYMVNNSGIGNNVANGNSFPVVKFAYSHYHEQRRKIDRLVQGLPVLTANGLSSLDRPSSKTSTEDHVPIIIVKGEEPIRSNHTRSRSSSQQKRDQSHYPVCKNSVLTPSTHNNIQQLSNHRNPLQATSSNFCNQKQSAPAHVRRNGSGAKLYNFKAPVTNNVAVTVDPGLALTTNDRISRIKTAPAPNRNLHRARQRILTRRGNRILEPSSQIPLQNCWAMAELTW